MNGHSPNGHSHEPIRFEDFAASTATQHLGSVVGGSLTKGLEVRLDPEVNVEQMAAGRYVTVDANGQLFFGMITDVELRTTMAALADSPPGEDDGFLRDVFRGTAA